MTPPAINEWIEANQRYLTAACGHPLLSPDLYYLLTPYATTSDGDFVDEMLTHCLPGNAMRVLHAIPVITEQLETSAGQMILHSSLLGQFEQVKLSLDLVSSDDLSKAWTALTVHYRLCLDAPSMQVEVPHSDSHIANGLALSIVQTLGHIQ